MTSRPPAQCVTCVHLRLPGDDGAPEPTWPDGTGSCDAYPNKVDAIPVDIWWNRSDHRQSRAGDRGIQWESYERAEFPDWAMNPAVRESSALARVRRVIEAAGHDTHPGGEEFRRYWTETPEGLAKWADTPTPYRSLLAHLVKFMDEEKAHRVAEVWFERVFHFAPGSDLNRVTHGKPPRGHVVGPG